MPELSSPVRHARNDDGTAPVVLAEAPSSFGKLPLELAGDIFINACGQNGQLPNAGQGRLRLTLQLVSKSWRQVVIGTQNLWNDLDLDLWDFESLTLDSSLHRAESWLRNAGDSCISLKLTTFCCSVQSRKAIFSFLSTYHFKALAIQSVPSNPSQLTLLDLDDSIKNSLETVMSLSLSMTWFYSHPSLIFPHQLPLFSLKYLTIKNMEIDSVYENLSSVFPWDQLLQVNLHHFMRVGSATEILRRCKSLIECKITVMDESTPTEKVESHVRHLYIRGGGAIAQSIHAPKLESLNVCSFDTAKVLARQSKDRLRWLVLRNQKSIDLREVLESMPSLQVVKISKAIISQETLHLLVIGILGRSYGK